MQWEPGIGAGAAGEHLAADEAQENFRWIRARRLDAVQPGCFLVHVTGPVGRRQGVRRLQRGVQRRHQGRAIRHQILQPLAQASGPRPPALSATQPAAQFGGLQPGQGG